MYDIDKIINKMTILEKARILTGFKTMETYPIERLNIPSLVFSDGPSGVRKEDENGDSLIGISNSLKTTSFPSGNNLASTWNKELIYSVSKAISEECKHYGVDMLLAPAVNIRRNPLCGRSFEYYSEDPYLSGIVGTYFVRGLEENNVLACVKHFACNNNETYRFIGNSVVDERALHEIYLKPFEMIIKNARPSAVMSAYNKINGIHASENKYLLKDILEEKWNFHGLNLTDWGGIVNRKEALLAGCDLEMPGMINHNINSIINSVKNGEITNDILDKSVKKILKLVKKNKEKTECDFLKNYNVAYEAATESAVLLKNNGVLPLNKNDNFLVVGDLFKKPRYQGSGSSLINPFMISSHEEVFINNNINFEYETGYVDNLSIEKQTKKIDKTTELLVNKACDKTQDKDIVIIFGGLTDYDESEGFDRTSLKLASNQIKLIKALSKQNKKMVLVLFGGSSIELSNIEKYFDAILYMGLPGCAIGDATYDLLFGNVSPSGKLPITWVNKYSDILNGESFVTNPNELYKESIYVGYRYFDTVQKDVLYPFGYGLSYTEFFYEFVSCNTNNEFLEFIINIKNKGKFDASDVIQIYASNLTSKVGRASKTLVGFEKVFLKQNESKEVTIRVNYEDLKIYDLEKQMFVLENGEYEFYISKSVKDVLFTHNVKLNGTSIISNIDYSIDNIIKLVNSSNDCFYEFSKCTPEEYKFEKRKYTLETPVYAYKTLTGKLIKVIVKNIGLIEYKLAKKNKKLNALEKERKMKTGVFISKMLLYNNIRSMCFGSSGMLKYNVACGLLDIVNGKIIKGTFKLLKKDKIKA